MTRTDADWLRDILDAISVIEQYRPSSREEFDSNPPVQSHLLRHIQLIGEAVSRMSQSIRAQHPQVPWREIAGMRNVIVHSYFQIDWNEVWNTIVNDIPPFKASVQTMLAGLTPPRP